MSKKKGKIEFSFIFWRLLNNIENQILLSYKHKVQKWSGGNYYQLDVSMNA